MAITLKTLIEERIRSEYSAMSMGADGVKILISLGLKSEEDLLTNRILALVSDEDKEILRQSLLSEKAEYLTTQKATQEAAVENVDTQLIEINEEIVISK